MATKQHEDAMYYLYGELKSSKISKEHAQRRKNTPEEQLKSIDAKIKIIEYLIDLAIKHM